jgi:PKD repeat protein
LAGKTITINGQSFNPQSSSVTFGAANGNSAQVLGGSASALSVVVPPAPSGFTFNTVPCGTGGTGTKKVATPIAVTVTDASTGCASATNNTFQLIPDDTTTCSGQTQQTPPTASFTATAIDGHTFQFVDSSTASNATIVAWQWDFGDGTSSATQNPSHSYSGPFPRNVSVKLRVTDSNGLSSNQAVQVITVPGP